MWRRLIVLLLVLLAAASTVASAQNSETSGQARELVHRVAPVYPDLARRLQLSGVVKLRATIAPDGSVKLIEQVGGNPLLVKAAQEAVTNWKYAHAPTETRELIELRFDMPR
jgi:TonB family protein